MIIVLSGPGGVGKGTVASLLVQEDPQILLSRSWTTRPQRPGEPDDAYTFVDRATFEARREAGGFLEWNEFLGNLYGTPMPDAVEARDLLLEIDVNGARQVAAAEPDALLVFVDAPDREEQRRRLEERGDPADAVARRLAEGDRERILARDLGCVVVVNDDVDRCVSAVLRLIEERRARDSADSMASKVTEARRNR